MLASHLLCSEQEKERDRKKKERKKVFKLFVQGQIKTSIFAIVIDYVQKPIEPDINFA